MKGLLAAALLLPLLILAGCGGGGSSPSNTTPSPFEGQWSGTWSDLGNKQTGTASATVSVSGVVSGSVTNITLQTAGTAAGGINSGGTAVITMAYPDATYKLTGTVEIHPYTGKLVGTLETYSGKTLVGYTTLSLTRQ